MFTSIDKALVALIMAAIFMINTFTDWNLGLSEDTINAIVGILSPILVWLVPNKQVA